MRGIALALFAARLLAQSYGSFTLSGELHHETPVDTSLLTVELIDSSSHLPVDHQIVTSNGDFELHIPSPGSYEIRVINRTRNIVMSEYATVSRMSGPISLRLPELKGPKPPSGSVSIGELRRKSNPKAAKEFKLAMKAKAKSQEPQMIQHLQAALELDPDYAPAHNALSEIYLKKQDYTMAAQEFEHVARLCPGIPQAHTNLAIALLHLRRFEEAESEAKTALKLAPADLKARYLMSVSLVAQHRMDPAELRKMSFQ